MSKYPVVQSFCINPVGEGNIVVEGSSRFVHERDFNAYAEWAKTCITALEARAEAAEKRLHDMAIDWLIKQSALQRAVDLIAKPARCHEVDTDPKYAGCTGTPRYSEGLRALHRECAELLPVLKAALEGKGEARRVKLPDEWDCNPVLGRMVRMSDGGWLNADEVLAALKAAGVEVVP